jgi:hypothetical protein
MHKPVAKNDARSLSRPKAVNNTVIIAEAPKHQPNRTSTTIVPHRDLSLPKAEKGSSLNTSSLTLVLSPIKPEPPAMVNNFMPLRSKTTTNAAALPERRYEEPPSTRRFEEPPSSRRFEEPASSRLYEPYSRPHHYEPLPSYAYPAYERPLSYGERPYPDFYGHASRDYQYHAGPVSSSLRGQPFDYGSRFGGYYERHHIY